MTHALLINACINGTIPTKEKNPFTPVTPEEILDEVTTVQRLGASIVHIHAHDHSGAPTWEQSHYRDIMAGIRTKVPDIVICLTTSGRLWSEPEKRAAVLFLEGEEKPDMASLTLGSFNFPGTVSVNAPATIEYLLDCMYENNIIPELEVFDLGMIDFAVHLAERRRLRRPLYMNIILGNRGTAAANQANLDFMVSRLPEGTLWAVGGIGKAQYPLHRMAITMGGHVRVGIEDNLYLDHRTKTPASNTALIQRVLDLAAEAQREPMTTAAVRALLTNHS